MSIMTQNQWFEAVQQRNYMLVERYADRFASSVNSHGETALMLATRAQDVQMMEILVSFEKGIFNKMGETALIIAIDNNLFIGIELLVRHESAVTGYDGSSPLHHVVRSNKVDFVPYLAPLLADKRDDSGRTPLELAAELGYTEMMERLIRHGLPVATADQINRAAQIAEQHGFLDCAHAIRNTSAPPIDPRGGYQVYSSENHMPDSTWGTSYDGTVKDQAYSQPPQSSNSIPLHESNASDAPGRVHVMSPYSVYSTNCPNCEKKINSLVALLIDRDQTVSELKHRLEVAQNDNIILRKKIRALEELQTQQYQGSLGHAIAEERMNSSNKFMGTNNTVDLGTGTFPPQTQAITKYGTPQASRRLQTTGGFTDRHLKCLTPDQKQQVLEDAATIETTHDFKTLRALGINMTNIVGGKQKPSSTITTPNDSTAKVLSRSISNTSQRRQQPSDTVLNSEPGSAPYSSHITRRYCESPSRTASRALSNSLQRSRANSTTGTLRGSATTTTQWATSRSQSRTQSRTQSVAGRSGSVVDRQRHMPPSKTNSMDETELMIAALNGDLMLVDQLRHTQVGYVNKYGKTALMYAAERNHVSCVTLLFLKESGKQDRDGMSALMYAAQYGYMTVCKTLVYAEGKLTRHDGMTALMLAAQNGHELVVSILMEFEAGYQNVDGMSALMLAAQNGHLECCKLLCTHELFLVDNADHDAIWYAREYGKQAIAIELKHYKDCLGK